MYFLLLYFCVSILSCQWLTLNCGPLKPKLDQFWHRCWKYSQRRHSHSSYGENCLRLLPLLYLSVFKSMDAEIYLCPFFWVCLYYKMDQFIPSEIQGLSLCGLVSTWMPPCPPEFLFCPLRDTVLHNCGVTADPPGASKDVLSELAWMRTTVQGNNTLF